MQTSDENREKYLLWAYQLIWYQILQTNIIRIIWQTVRRITNEILKVKGLNQQCAHWVHVYEAGLYNWVWGLKYASCVKECFLIEWHKTKPKVITDQPEDKKVTLKIHSKTEQTA